MSEELRHAITKFLLAIHWAFKLPASQITVMLENINLFFFPLPAKLQTHSATMLKLLALFSYTAVTALFCLSFHSQGSGSMWVNGTLFE